jgi:putative spermidine/putrescine transport system ATP-binding protein
MLFDEPLSNLDAKLRVEMRAEIKQLHTRLRLTSIYVTHDQAEALSLSDRIVVLREGVLMQVGTPQEIHDRPANVFVADFMGFRNFFDVKLGPANGGQIDVTAKGGTFRSRAADGLTTGQDAVLAIRPDDVKVGAGDGQYRLRGKVELVEYLGREVEAAVMTEGQGRVWLRTPEKIALGDTVDIALPPDKLVLLRKE